jgi:uncharacterized protein (TIGR03435 family)
MRFLPQSILVAVVLAASAGLSQTATPSITPIQPMTVDAHPSFAVATIKPHDPDSQHQGIEADGDRFRLFDQPVSSMIAYAYSINRLQIVDAPAWLTEVHYDIDGRADIEGEPNLRQQQEMLQKLLADRFQLQFHKSTREMDVYALRIAKGGPKLAPATDPKAKFEEHANGRGLETTRTYTNASMTNFVLVEQFFYSTRPLVDQTGLTGRYDFKLNYTYDEMHNTDQDAPPGMFTAIQEQLGLRLEPIKAPIDVFVIDHVEKPSAN